MKPEFFENLESNDEFCQALGKMMLVSGRLEVLLRKYLRCYDVDVPERRATLGNLIKLLQKNNRITTNGLMHFNHALLQRNYLIHNLYGSFVDEVESPMLPNENLEDMDVETYTEKVLQSVENFEHYANIVHNAIDRYNNYKKLGKSHQEPLL